jgi:tetratricopeptide (TPR) repeat protein
MAGADPHTCPPPEVLGAYIEGKVDAPTRIAVQRHVVDCPECVFVIAEASRYLASDDADAEEETEDAKQTWPWSAGIAAAVGLVCVLTAWFIAVARDPLHDLRRAAAAVPTRPIEGRLDGFSYSPYRSPRSNAVREDAVLRIRAERIVRLAGSDARTWHARAVAALVLGKNAAAVAMLERAALLAPHEARYRSDLAAALIAAAPNGDVAKLRAAVRAAERATALEPSLAAAHFNRAVALQHLDAYDTAAQAYDRYLALDPNSPWSAEVRERRTLLPR